ncbi:hypothetical protein C2845_PM08G16760 [Panicum miliaceum]|uniref:F-box protein At3g26010-like beta-propeller domain-containing protein n=1 Tax=Panicum miliaceum TaxID=4540 RepID=A0A3L6R387_PANMI|nr:hypothetical protein C2845_PM08G16760 [Panicum miliaceum]
MTSTGGGASSASMDALCDTLLVEEILPRLPPKSLLRLGATSRRYEALARSLGFAARYWRRAGAFLQPAAEQPGVFPRFLTAPAMPGGGARARGSTWPAARYFVCNPVTRQQTALPELRDLCFKPRCGLLTVAAAAGTDGGGHGAAPRFQVVVIEEWQIEDTFLGLKIFSSDTGTWRSRMASLYRYSSLPFEHDFRRRPALGQSGAAYWIQRDGRTAIAYDSAGDSLRVIHLPESGARSKRCIGERHGGGGAGGGGGLRYAVPTRRSSRCGTRRRRRAARGGWRTGLASGSCWD